MQLLEELKRLKDHAKYGMFVDSVVALALIECAEALGTLWKCGDHAACNGSLNRPDICQQCVIDQALSRLAKAMGCES